MSNDIKRKVKLLLLVMFTNSIELLTKRKLIYGRLLPLLFGRYISIQGIKIQRIDISFSNYQKCKYRTSQYHIVDYLHIPFLY